MYSTIYATFKDKEEAANIISILLEKKLIACSNLFPISSSYFWKGDIASSEEVACLMKAKTVSFKDVEKEIKKHHSYDVPCIIRYEIKEGNKDYLDWIDEGTR